MEQKLSIFRSVFPLFFLAFSLVSCSPRLTPFTRDIYESGNWSDADLKKIQFYLSEDLVLYRNLEKDGQATISGGEIKIVDGKRVEQVRFRSGTPGIFLQRPKEDHFAISFESGDDTRFLMFGPNPKMGGEYALLASEWNRRTGKVTYAGEKFSTSSPEVPRLLVNMKYKKTREVKSREASGRKVD